MENAISKNQFVIQEHKTSDGIHWDLMLEHGGLLWTWRIGVHPSEICEHPIPAERIADHPLKFLTYQGPVQNGTASVSIVDKGVLSLRKISSRLIDAEFDGNLLKGSFTLRPDKAPFWTLRKSKICHSDS